MAANASCWVWRGEARAPAHLRPAGALGRAGAGLQWAGRRLRQGKHGVGRARPSAGRPASGQAHVRAKRSGSSRDTPETSPEVWPLSLTPARPFLRLPPPSSAGCCWSLPRGRWLPCYLGPRLRSPGTVLPRLGQLALPCPYVPNTQLCPWPLASGALNRAGLAALHEGRQGPRLWALVPHPSRPGPRKPHDTTLCLPPHAPPPAGATCEVKDKATGGLLHRVGIPCHPAAPCSGLPTSKG